MEQTKRFYVRSDLVTLTGVDDTTLTYWLREGLISATSGEGAGRGKHRRFDFMQVNIVAILGAAHRFRLSLAPMRALAEMLQEAARIGDTGSLHPSSYEYAARIASDVARFQAGEEVLVPTNGHRGGAPAGMSIEEKSAWYSAKRPAVSEDEVIAKHTDRCSEYDGARNVREAAKRMGPGKEVPALLYGNMTFDLLAPGYSDRQSWLLTLRPDDGWRVRIVLDGEFFIAGKDNVDEAEPAIFIPVHALLQRVWGLKSTEKMREEREAAYLEAEAN